MADSISPRAQAILDQIEREAGPWSPEAATSSPAGVSSSVRPNLPEPPRAVVAADLAGIEPTPGAPRVDLAGAAPGNAELSRLVEDAVAQADRARLRLAALAEAVEDIASRLGSPLEVSATTNASDVEPAPVTLAPASVARAPHAPPPPPPMYKAMEAALPPPPPRPRGARGAAPAADPPPVGAVHAPPAPVSVDYSARLVAVEMAVSGLTRDEVGEHLRSLYGIARPEATLDVIFGAGTPGSSRIEPG